MGLTTFFSPAFRDNELLPVRFAQEGAGISPSLRWQRVPAGRPYLTIVVTVLGAPQTEVRWLLYDVLDFTGPIREGMVPLSGQVGLNGQGSAAWWPPDALQQRTLVFDLYASNQAINSDCPLSWHDVQVAQANHNVSGPFSFQTHYPAVPKGTVQ